MLSFKAYGWELGRLPCLFKDKVGFCFLSPAGGRKHWLEHMALLPVT